jgi:hypothetical protein
MKLAAMTIANPRQAMNESLHGVTGLEAEQPQNDQDYPDCVKHTLPLSFGKSTAGQRFEAPTDSRHLHLDFRHCGFDGHIVDYVAHTIDIGDELGNEGLFSGVFRAATQGYYAIGGRDLSLKGARRVM